jgi:hypothetical protein
MMKDWTQKMMMHLNGGEKFSVLDYEIYHKKKLTRITRHTRTSGSPHYLKEVDVLMYGDEHFDILASKGKGMEQWLNEQLAKGADGTPPSR